MCADFLDLRRQMDVIAAEGVEYLHLDLMDGHYVDNLTLGIDFCNRLAAEYGIAQDIHMMVDRVETFIGRLDQKGAIVCFHPETADHPFHTLEKLRKAEFKIGLAINPAITVEHVKYLLPHVDMVNLMMYEPGFAGQSLLHGMLEKIGEFRRYVDENELDIEIEVDGNVSFEHGPEMRRQGADIFVCGTSSVFRQDEDLASSIPRFREVLETATS